METQTQKQVLNLNGLKMVKEARSSFENGVFLINHYNREILKADFNKNPIMLYADLDGSKTSNKQIYRAFELLGMTKEIGRKIAINTHEGEKWNYSGANE